MDNTFDEKKLVGRVDIDGVPPSVNNLYGRTNYGKVYVKTEAIQWKSETARRIEHAIYQGYVTPVLNGEVRLKVLFRMKNYGRRDVDNGLKLLLDSIQFSGLIHNDSQITDVWATKVPASKKHPPQTTIWLYAG